MIKVSIIIPVYNVGTYIRKTIKSCLKQDLREIEIIVVNDGSSDDSLEIIQELAKFNEHLVVLDKNNEGVSLARKDGLLRAKGEYIFFLDGDDFLEYNALSIMLKEAQRCNSDYVIGDFRLVDENCNELQIRKFGKLNLNSNIEFLNYCYTNEDFYLTGRLIRSSLLRKIDMGMYSKITFGEDNIIVTILGSFLQNAVSVDKIILNYVQRSCSVTNRLSVSDLNMRGKACAYSLAYVSSLPIYFDIEKSCKFFALKEIYSSIRRGVLDKSLKNNFLVTTSICSLCKHAQMSWLSRFVLISAKINTDWTISCIQFFKKLYRMFNI